MSIAGVKQGAKGVDPFNTNSLSGLFIGFIWGSERTVALKLMD